MIRSLREERGQERTAAHNAGVAANRSGTHTPTMSFGTAVGGPGTGSGSRTPDSGASGDESSAAAIRARAHRDKLLSFQSQNAQRTKIHDEASDFDAGLDGARGTQWMSPVQRAAALKKQQKYMREMEEQGRPEWERNKTVVSLGFKNGKLVKSYGKAPAKAAEVEVESDGGDDVEGADDVLEDAGDAGGGSGRGKFSDNPLLRGGGLIRPVWKPKDGTTLTEEKGKGRDEAAESTRERKSIWRRVQDDNEDNEQWILDGGLRGFGVERRRMEDGSHVECG